MGDNGETGSVAKRRAMVESKEGSWGVERAQPDSDDDDGTPQLEGGVWTCERRHRPTINGLESP